MQLLAPQALQVKQLRRMVAETLWAMDAVEGIVGALGHAAGVDRQRRGGDQMICRARGFGSSMTEATRVDCACALRVVSEASRHHNGSR